MRFAFRILLWSELQAAARIRNYREQQLTERLKQDLERWLDDIKRHLEADNGENND